MLGLQRGALRVKIQQKRKERAKRKKVKRKDKTTERKGEVRGFNSVFSGSKWSYKTMKIGGDATLTKKLDEMGNKGWELISVTPDRGTRLKCIFKKPA